MPRRRRAFNDMEAFWKYMRMLVAQLPSVAELNDGVEVCRYPARDRYRPYLCCHAPAPHDIANLDDLGDFDDVVASVSDVVD